jgi:hypothetical protein
MLQLFLWKKTRSRIDIETHRRVSCNRACFVDRFSGGQGSIIYRAYKVKETGSEGKYDWYEAREKCQALTAGLGETYKSWDLAADDSQAKNQHLSYLRS